MSNNTLGFNPDKHLKGTGTKEDPYVEGGQDHGWRRFLRRDKPAPFRHATFYFEKDSVLQDGDPLCVVDWKKRVLLFDAKVYGDGKSYVEDRFWEHTHGGGWRIIETPKHDPDVVLQKFEWDEVPPGQLWSAANRTRHSKEGYYMPSDWTHLLLNWTVVPVAHLEPYHDANLCYLNELVERTLRKQSRKKEKRNLEVASKKLNALPNLITAYCRFYDLPHKAETLTDIVTRLGLEKQFAQYIFKRVA